MKSFVQRTVSELDQEGPVSKRQHVSIDEYRCTPAWVLLGDPGSGKTRQFEHEVQQCRDRGEPVEFITARNFAILGDDRSGWDGATVFIDALDEVRAGGRDGQWYFDLIRKHLYSLGKPRFRISCRDADWFGETDRNHLAHVSQNAKLVTLRLDGFNSVQLRTHLKTYKNIPDIETFINDASNNRVDSLLTNPQTLDMLVQLVTERTGWPTSRFELFERACERMAIERNPQHRLPPQRPQSTTAILDAAGRMCALQLLTGNLECVTTPSESRLGTVTVHDLPPSQLDAIVRALATNIFRPVSHGGQTPVHRSVAEFLAARHLSRVIEDGLPAQRILAFITGADGFVITPLRGLSAWLATHSTIARPTMIAIDPVGVALYGDLRRFSRNQQKLLMKELLRRLTVQTDIRHLASTCARIASTEIDSILKEHLRLNDRSDQGQRITTFILEMLLSADNLEIFSDDLIEIIDDIDRPIGIKQLALKAFLRNQHHQSNEIKKLLVLLKRTRDQTLEDPDGDLAGELLSYLYPRHLGAKHVINYLHDGVSKNSAGPYYRFWSRHISEQSDETDAAIILEQISINFDSKISSIRRYMIYEFPCRLLLVALKASSDTLPIDRLYKWLRMILSIMQYRPNRAREEIDRIKNWIESRPQIAMGLMNLAFEMRPLRQDRSYHDTNIEKILLGASPPPAFGNWCLEKALSISAEQPMLSVDLLLRCYQEFALRKHASGLTLDSIESVAKRIGYDGPLERAYGRLNVDRQSKNKVSNKRREWLTAIRTDVGRLSAESGNAQVLHIVGRAYFDLIHELDAEGGFAAVYELLENDRHLIEPLSQGLLHVYERRDLPSVAKIVGLFAEHKQHILGLPFLACVEWTLHDDAIDRRVWNTEQVGRAVAFYYAEPYLPEPAAGFCSLLNSDPEATIKVLTQMMLVDISAHKRVPWKASRIVELLIDQDLKRRASLEIISRYPLKCTAPQIEVLDPHIWQILVFEQPILREIVVNRLSRKTLNLGQRVRWMTVSALLGSDNVMRDYVRFITKTPRRLVHFTTFMRSIAYSNYSQLFVCLRMLDTQWQVRLVNSMLRILAGYSSPSDQFRSGWIDSRVDMSLLISRLIEFLSTVASSHASRLLGDLCEDSRFSQWRRLLQFRRELQLTVARDACFEYATVKDVNHVLESGPAASSGDLFALVLNCLDSMRESYRVDDANRWRAFWSEDSYGNPKVPKAENSCRDALLHDLRHELHRRVHIEAERHTVFDNRVDILVSYRDFTVPLEIKKDSNRSVWTAIREQLMKKYVRDNTAEGYGIYVVLWFGVIDTNSSKDRDGPADPDEVRKEIIRRAALTDSELRKIGVVVFDLSVPRLSSA